MWCFKIVFGYVVNTVMTILCFTVNKPLVDIVSSYVKHTVMLILDLFCRAHCKSVEYIAAGYCKFLLSSFQHSVKLVAFSGFLKCCNHIFYGHP